MVAYSIDSSLAIFLLLDFAKLDDEHLSHGITLSLLVEEHVVNDTGDLVEDGILALISIHFLKKVVRALFHTKASEPSSKAILLHIKADHAINE